MGYILFTYDALLEFASGRFFQSFEFSQSEQLCEILTCRGEKWNHPTIYLSKIKDRGLIFFTKKLDEKRGLLFDLDTFQGFENQNSQAVITIFQKTIKYGIRYFDKQPLAPCEHDLSGERAIVYPYPFAATRGVEKVLLDKNSTKQNRKEQDFLVAFYFGTGDGTFIQTNLNKAVKDLSSISVPAEEQSNVNVESLKVNQFDSPSLLIDSPLNFEEWGHYLTKVQADFVHREIKGAERLEGPAGSGKTLSLILRCINLLEAQEKKNEPYKIIFITHSLPTKEMIVDLFKHMYSNYEMHAETRDNHPMTSILVTTLQEWSKENLGANVIYDTELIDRDASISKGYQLMMIEEAYNFIREKSWNGFECVCSKEFRTFINTENMHILLDMLQYEISVVIKGRAEGRLDEYKNLERPLWGIPAKIEEDKQFLYSVFEKYQESLEHSGQFDTDDITLSALGQLDTPIWKRRSIKEGYDACFIDEAHLFNFNELSLFHFLNKPKNKNHIVYVLDKSQYCGEVGFTESELKTLENGETQSTKLNTVFRSSQEIVNLAYNVLSSSVSLFTSFQNPLDHCSSPFTKEEDSKCKNPEYKLLKNDSEMIDKAISDAEDYCNHYNVCKHDVLFVVTDNVLLNDGVLKYLRKHNKAFVQMQSRNDYSVIDKARADNKFVVSGIDFVGGLEFNAVFIIGVDKGRVPPEANAKGEANQFISYAWHNRMYVAISRAKYFVSLYGNAIKGKSGVLDMAVENHIVNFSEES